jgi:hypothetical protein
MSTLTRSILIAFACATLTGCAPNEILFAWARVRDQQRKLCLDFANKGVAVTPQTESTIPVDEGEVHTFEPTFWRMTSTSEDYPEAERPDATIVGKLVITERSVIFVPPPARTGVRIPREVVLSVELRKWPLAGPSADERRSIIVRSCIERSEILERYPIFERYDIFTIREMHDPSRVNSSATAAAVAQLKARAGVRQ